MKIVYKRPPNYDELNEKFHIGNKAILFCWGSIIYNPQGVFIPPELEVHEQVHSTRQGWNAIGWWQKYLKDEMFRLEEEVLAHRAEYHFLIDHGNRRAKRRALKTISHRLASPMYGKMVSFKQAQGYLKI